MIRLTLLPSARVSIPTSRTATLQMHTESQTRLYMVITLRNLLVMLPPHLIASVSSKEEQLILKSMIMQAEGPLC